MNHRPAGVLDRRLRQRLEQYLASSNHEYVDLTEVALELQKRYRAEYGRRNKTAFRIQVEKVYQTITNESGLNDLQSKPLAKRAKHGDNDTGDDSSLSEGSSNSDDNVLDNARTNHMNSSLACLYQKGNPDSLSGDRPTVNPPPSAETLVSTGGWFIDRDQGSKRNNTFIDLCEEEPIDRTKTEMLEPEKSTKLSKKRTKSSTETTDYRTLNKKVKSKSLDLHYPTLKFEDVGVTEETLTDMCKLLIHMHHPEVYQKLGMVPPRGFLLHGPPGCGKTLLAQAVAGEMDLPMLKVSAPELVSGVSGESEQKLRELFGMAVVSRTSPLSTD